MASKYLAKYTHRTTHVESHKTWLASRNLNELPEWPDCGQHDCLFGAVLRGMNSGGFLRCDNISLLQYEKKMITYEP
jgi:hypothetical protein